MNVFLLLSALKAVLEKHAPSLLLPARERKKRTGVKTETEATGVWRAPKVFIGSMPPGVADAMETVPFVLIQTLEGQEVGDGLHLVRVAFRLAVQDEDGEAAENHLHNLLSLVRQAVMGSLECRVLDGKYSMRPDEQGRLWYWRRPDEQLPPFAEAYTLTTWAIKGIE
jgi:hypothetical protein